MVATKDLTSYTTMKSERLLMAIQLLMPQLGESVVEGTISKWLVREGDTIAREQSLVVVSTDKADSDLPAPSSGKVARILAAEGQVVKDGQPH